MSPLSMNPAMIKDLEKLVRLEYDTLEACRSAQRRCKNGDLVTELAELVRSHEQRIQGLVPVVRYVGGRVPRAGDARQFVTQGRMLTGSVFGQTSLISALKDNEVDLAQAYRRVLARDDLHDGIRERLEANVDEVASLHRRLSERIDGS